MTPLDILADEVKHFYERLRRGEQSANGIRKPERELSFKLWQS